ncbi:tetratricopeptide repeat protein [Parabacteroides sp. OttesenSCG-928-G06]|nr:tetratricopeptide repeat protein [Parabacteroides sp. OttesenSCG-928-K15]MDL2282799.1 tetratricopeptide repeat protein [Parabacteroides sp. OttesenSCG-928-G06]
MLEPDMMNLFTKRIIYIVGIACLSMSLQAQSLDQAKKLYNEGQYEEAKPAFERLVKQSPNNGSYNHWYGVCCYETGDLENAEKHLKVGITRKVMESSRYLAEVYFTLYRFEESSEMYEDYIDQLTKKKQDVEPFRLRQNQADNAQRMLDKVEEVEVIDSVVVDKNNFLNAYALSEESGSLIPFIDFFPSAANASSVVYRNQKADKIYYARETEDNQLCLFTQSYLMDHWGDEKQLPMNVNSSGDDNYPFVLTDGVTIYYASKGNGSLGGYDIFVTRYNMNNDTYLTPEQLGMPYNSPYNDYMIVFDEVKGLGWFVSDRFQPEDKVCVYLFIPNEQRKRIESEDVEMKRARAMLADIRVTQKEGEDYSDRIELAYEEMPYGQEEIKKDFEFVVTNDVVYYTLDDIQSPEARSLYEKVVALQGQINTLKETLEEQRDAYAAANSAQKQNLQPQILQNEQQLSQLQSQPAELEKKARNAEILYLRKNNTR